MALFLVDGLRRGQIFTIFFFNQQFYKHNKRSREVNTCRQNWEVRIKRQFSSLQKPDHTNCETMRQNITLQKHLSEDQCVLACRAWRHRRQTSSEPWSPTPTFMDVFSKQKQVVKTRSQWLSLPMCHQPGDTVRACAASTKPVEQQQQPDGGGQHTTPRTESGFNGDRNVTLLASTTLKLSRAHTGRGLGVALRSACCELESQIEIDLWATAN